jgi:agmatinase
LCAIARKRKDLREGTRWDRLLPLLSERAAPIPEGTIQPNHHTHLGHDQEK